MGRTKVDVSIVLACYNEGPTLEQSLNTVQDTMSKTKYSWEVICIDDNSSDDTANIINKFASKNKNFSTIYHKKNKGRGATVREGMLKSRGEVTGYIDVDLEVDAVYIPKFVQTIKSDVDVAIAHRIYKEEIIGVLRWLASKLYVIVVRSVLGLDFKDTEAGYKFFNRKKIIPVLKKTKNNGWFFDTEVLAESSVAGLKINEIPVLFVRRPDKKSTVRLIPDTIDYIKAITAYKKLK